MQELRNDNLSIVEPFLSAFKYHTVLKTMVSGTSYGYVCVNDLVSPEIVYAQFRHRAFITGDLTSINKVDFEQFFVGKVFENCRIADVSQVRLAAKPEAWLNLLGSSLNALNPIFFNFQIYQCRLSDSDQRPKIPEGFELRQVNKALVNEAFDGKDALLEEMCSERESVNAFLDNSFGIVAFHGKKLAGWCLSEYNHKKRCEVGIATMPPFRRQGLAKAITLDFLNLTFEQGLDTVLWHCCKSNRPSQLTALSSGFELINEHKVMNIYLEPAVRFAVHGNVEFEKDNFIKAISWYQQALNEPSPSAWMAWNAACAAAHIHREESVFEYLNLSIDLGFSDLELFKKSKHFRPFHDDARWVAIIERL